MPLAKPGSGWFVALAAVALTLLPARAPAADITDSTPITDALRDGSGRVWGIAPERSPDLFTFDGSPTWHPTNPQGLGQAARPVTFVRRADGAVVCVWRQERRFRWSVQRGADAQVGPLFDLNERRFGEELRLTADSKNNVWITQAGPNIYCLTPEGVLDCVHTITREECLEGSRTTVWSMVSVFEDTAGRLWFWADHADGSKGHNIGTIRGALVYDGSTFVQHDFLLPGGGEQVPLTLLAQKDPGHLWFGRRFDALYTLDTATFQAERVADQPADASVTTLAVRGAGGGWDFVMGQNRPEGGCALWRLADGRWTKLIDPIDAHYELRRQQDRVWSPAEQGNFLGTNGNGLWFLPRDGSDPVHVDWRQRFPVASPSRFLDLDDGRWLAVGTGGETWVGTPVALTAERALPANPRVRTLRVEQRLYADVRGHLWSAFAYNSPVLHEWDGERWSEHRFPAELGAQPALRMLNTDARGRVWLRSTATQRRVAVYDPAADHWQVYDDFESALQAQDDRAGSEFRTVAERYDLPRFGPQGRICYLDNQKIATFAEGVWRSWTRMDITGQRKGYAFDGPPFIDRAGRISVNFNSHTWEMQDGAVWKETAYEPGFMDHDVPPAETPTEKALGFQPASAACDNQGSWWLTWQRGLFRFRDGLLAPVLRAGEPQPFGDGRRVAEAIIDARGNAFLRSGDAQEEYVILAPAGPLPRTTAAEAAEPDPAKRREDRRMVRLTTDAKPVEGKTRFGWRLDGGDWKAIAADGPGATVTLEDLPGGPHRFEARSYDPSLQTDVVPAALDFRVDLDPQAQVAGLVSELAAPDDNRRRAAVFALARQPAQAQPALEAARARTTDTDARWWIDAALQQIETNRGAVAK